MKSRRSPLIVRFDWMYQPSRAMTAIQLMSRVAGLVRLIPESLSRLRVTETHELVAVERRGELRIGRFADEHEARLVVGLGHDDAAGLVPRAFDDDVAHIFAHLLRLRSE